MKYYRLAENTFEYYPDIKEGKTYPASHPLENRTVGYFAKRYSDDWVEIGKADCSDPVMEEEGKAMISNEDHFSQQIHCVLQDIRIMLEEKNRKYGDAALRPLGTFSKLPPVEQIKVRIDDKLSRIASCQDDEDEDVVNDLIGYLVLLKVAGKR